MKVVPLRLQPGAHLHIAVADSEGAVIGGHLGAGSLVRTTAELDSATGYAELRISPRAPD